MIPSRQAHRVALPMLTAAVLLLSGCRVLPAASPPAATSLAPAVAGSARAVLAALPVKGRAPRTGYDRRRFGPAWQDVDRNGCDTRNDVLARDLHDLTLRAGTRGCVVLAGTLADPYSGTALLFAKAHASQVQIDHVVALSNAWQTGAASWTADRRLAFANDLLNLLATSGPLNQQKGDGDAATWLPPAQGYRCAYVARQVAVKAAYGLWVVPAERDALARQLQRCPDEPVPTGP